MPRHAARLARLRRRAERMPVSPARDSMLLTAHMLAMLDEDGDAPLVAVELRRLEQIVRLARARRALAPLFIDVLVDIEHAVCDAYARQAVVAPPPPP